MLFMLNIDELIINYINLNDQINKRVRLIVSCCSITNLIIFEFINFDTIIIRIMFKLTYLKRLIQLRSEYDLLCFEYSVYSSDADK